MQKNPSLFLNEMSIWKNLVWLFYYKMQVFSYVCKFLKTTELTEFCNLGKIHTGPEMFILFNLDIYILWCFRLFLLPKRCPLMLGAKLPFKGELYRFIGQRDPSKQTDRQTERQTDKQADKHTDRHPDFITPIKR